jgi:hypothetical protein
MLVYKIAHKGSEFLVTIIVQDNKYVAKITGISNMSVVLITGCDPGDIYRNCYSWASANIRGEFTFEEVSPSDTAA